jgi:hypothetical protein
MCCAAAMVDLLQNFEKRLLFWELGRQWEKA